MIINENGQLHEEVVTLRDLNEGEHFRFVYERRERYLSQKGKIEGYCPIVGDYGSSISGEEVYLLSAKVVRLAE